MDICNDTDEDHDCANIFDDEQLRNLTNAGRKAEAAGQGFMKIFCGFASKEGFTLTVQVIKDGLMQIRHALLLDEAKDASNLDKQKVAAKHVKSLSHGRKEDLQAYKAAVQYR